MAPILFSLRAYMVAWAIPLVCEKVKRRLRHRAMGLYWATVVSWRPELSRDEILIGTWLCSPALRDIWCLFVSRVKSVAAQLDHSYNCRTRSSSLRWTTCVYTRDGPVADSTIWAGAIFQRDSLLPQLTFCLDDARWCITMAIRRVIDFRLPFRRLLSFRAPTWLSTEIIAS